MNNRIILSVFFLLTVLAGRAGSLDNIRQALEQSSVSQVQEKVYIHTDNTCYFVGDTLWYKAYVVRADNLHPTDMSRILYVELLSPDGLLVERQNIIVAPEGYTCGQFVLQDSLYSGYYELRAYTRWMLNFNQREHMYTKQETWSFYNKQMAHDYYRVWDGLYSRVLPIYSKPETAGDYDLRRMYQRPKTRIPKPRKEKLQVSFFPEGGHLVQGLASRVAFEATDQYGEAVDVKGTVWDGDRQVGEAVTEYMGRGCFSVTPANHRLEVRFRWRDKDYSFNLPKAESAGAVMTLDGNRLTIKAVGLPQDRDYGLSVLCRGALKHFEQVPLSGAAGITLSLPVDGMEAGVHDVTLFDSDGRILADRLFFMSPMGPIGPISPISPISPIGPISPTKTYAPYEAITVGLQLPEAGTTFSLAVRDTRTDEPTYDDGNILTSMLLSSELRGFIAKPAYYFEKDDEMHRRHLDLLMMVQGWRKYKWQELADTAFAPRYQPEQTLTVSGAVYRMLGITEVEQDEIPSWQDGLGRVGSKNNSATEEENPWAEETESDFISTEDEGNVATSLPDASSIEYGSILDANDELGVNHSGLKHEVLVEAELVMGRETVAAVQKTQNGRFVFEIPPFYGATFLNLKAYKEKDSLKKSMLSRSDATVYREDAFADYYVKRDMPYPIFTHDYNFYENHMPDMEVTIDEDSLSELSMENDVHQLRNINVKGKRRGQRAVDWTKPAFVRDAYDLYNDITDYGLSYGKFDMRQFPIQIAKFLYGNMGRYNRFNVDGRLNGHTYWRNYNPDPTDMAAESRFRANRTGQAVYKDILLSRLQDIRIYSDYEPRKEDTTMVENFYAADATVEMVPIADDGKQIVYRDRHIYFHGMSMPEEFYQPDYSNRALDERPADYRRTLYWNPNAKADEQGRFHVTLYNNSRDTRIKISAAGVSPDGRLLYY